MKLRGFLVVQLTIGLIQHTWCTTTENLERYVDSTKNLISGKYLWIFREENGAPHYLNHQLEASGLDSNPGFDLDVTKSGGVSAMIDTAAYCGRNASRVIIDPNGRLSTSDKQHPSPEDRFSILDVPGSPGKFNFINWNDREVIVTPKSNPPFYFYSKASYPAIKFPAEFSLQWVPINISEIYDGTRLNVHKVAQLIKDSPYVYKIEAYQELLREMKIYGHFVGQEIFTVGHYISADIGVENAAFKMLPTLVQLISSGQPVELFYMNDDLRMRMRSYLADDGSGKIYLPYTFEYQPLSEEPLNQGWTFRYEPYSNMRLTQVRGSSHGEYHLWHTEDYVYRQATYFTISLHESLSIFFIRSIDPFAPGSLYAHPNSDGKYVFWVNNSTNSNEAKFGAVNYTNIDSSYVERLYGGKRENILNVTRFISESSRFMNQTAAYDYLLHLMEANGHIQGREIFFLAVYTQYGFYSVFQKLPYTVKLAFRDVYIIISFVNSGLFPMEYSWATNPRETGSILPYRLHRTYYQDRYLAFGLTYADEYVLKFGDDNNLVDVKSSTIDFVFQLSLEPNLEDIQIYSEFSYEPLYTERTQADFHFKADGAIGRNGAVFRLEEYGDLPTTTSIWTTSWWTTTMKPKTTTTKTTTITATTTRRPNFFVKIGLTRSLSFWIIVSLVVVVVMVVAVVAVKVMRRTPSQR